MRGTLVSFDAGSYTAVVRADGSPTDVLPGLRVARNLAAAEMTPGRRVLVDTGDSGELDAIVVYGVYA